MASNKAKSMVTSILKKEWYLLLLLIVPYFVSFYVWNDLPESVPIHFDINGAADSWGPKWINAFLLPSIGVFVYGILLFLPMIDPKKKVKSNQKPIRAIRHIMTVFMLGIYVYIIAQSLGYELDIMIYFQIAVGLLILLTGNYMNSVKQNYFIGVRTPWTLESGEVWKQTHKFTARLWTIAGLYMIIVPLLFSQNDISWIMIISITVIISIIPIVYSFIIRQKEEVSNA